MFFKKEAYQRWWDRCCEEYQPCCDYMGTGEETDAYHDAHIEPKVIKLNKLNTFNGDRKFLPKSLPKGERIL